MTCTTEAAPGAPATATVDLGLPVRRRTRDELRRLAERASGEFDGRDPLLVLEWASRTFGRRVAVTSSMTDAVLPHLVSRVRPGVDVLFVDPGYHFAETLGTRDAVEATLPVNVVTVRPELTRSAHEARYGELWRTDPDLCCAMRKVGPLERAMQDYDVWVTGVRREESATRRDARLVEWDERRGKIKVNPLVAWTQFDVDRYVDWFDLLVNPLTQMGYPSIGCETCTRPVAEGEDPRAGRWAGRSKTECGIHA
jgi:phosphoadenosine phosphosulfate reductase